MTVDKKQTGHFKRTDGCSDESIKHAEEHGFFFHPTKEALLSHCEKQNCQCNNVADLRLICLNGAHLRAIEDIGLCKNLAICLLANNFITRVDALGGCSNLIRLDLHSNQLISIPGPSFWENLGKLHVLHLHDNPIGKFETSQSLSSAPCLSILTMYDTPLSLRKNYRHHVVNSIYTLKALDHHVISDEEIIEDVTSTGRFTALSPTFKENLCPKSDLKCTFAQEMAALFTLIGKVNSILARHSPVHIIQRYARGYLVRRRMGKTKKQLPANTKELMTHPPSTPIFFSSPIWTPLPVHTVDYNSYMRDERPSYGVKENALKVQQLPVMSCTAPNQTFHQEDEELFKINVQKLKSGIISGLQADKNVIDGNISGRNSFGFVSRKECERKKHGKENTDIMPKTRRIKDIKQFFGPVVSSSQPDKEGAEEEEEGDIPLAHFRLRGRKPKILLVDATAELILSRKEAGQMVREAEVERIKKELMMPTVAVKHKHNTTAEQRLFKKVYGTMGFTCLMAVHKAYQDREKMEAIAAKSENLLALREQRLRAKEKIMKYRQEIKESLLKSRDLDKSHISENIQQQELQKLNFLGKLQERKVKRSDFSKELKADYSFMQQFSCQLTSISNALVRYNRQVLAEDNKNKRQRQVSSAKKTEQEQHDVVKRYLEHRNLMKQTEAAANKATLKAKLQTEDNERKMEAKNRVAQQKARKASNVVYYSLTSKTVSDVSSIPSGTFVLKTCSQVSLAGGEDRCHSHYT